MLVDYNVGCTNKGCKMSEVLLYSFNLWPVPTRADKRWHRIRPYEDPLVLGPGPGRLEGPNKGKRLLLRCPFLHRTLLAGENEETIRNLLRTDSWTIYLNTISIIWKVII
jgi:hypothetical protein